MKLSVSLPENDVAVLDEYARTSGLKSRSAVVQYAIGLLRHPNLEQDYAAAWAEWEAGGDGQLWDAAGSDGIADAPR